MEKNTINEVAVRKLRVQNQLETLKLGWTRIYIHTVRQPWFLGNEVLTSGASLYPLQSHSVPTVNAQHNRATYTK